MSTIPVNDIYLTFCGRINEPPALQLGIITESQFLEYLQDAINDFCRDTGIAKVFVTQPIEFSVPRYTTPDCQISIEALLVQGRFKPRTNIESLDNSRFRWRQQLGPVDVWHEDGLPINTVSLVAKPNWSGAQYPAQASGAPGYQYIDGTQVGAYAGTATSNGTNVITLVTGGPFWFGDTTWFGKTFVFGGVPFVIANVPDSNHVYLTANVPPAVGVPWSVNYPISLPVSDRNLTTFGSRMPDPQTYALDTIIPLIPNSACLYIGYAILFRVYSSDSELKDLQKAAYCEARKTEGTNIFRAILREELLDESE